MSLTLSKWLSTLELYNTIKVAISSASKSKRVDSLLSLLNISSFGQAKNSPTQASGMVRFGWNERISLE